MSKSRNRNRVPTRKQLQEQRKQEDRALSKMEGERKSDAARVANSADMGYDRCECGSYVDPEIGCMRCE